MLHRLVASHADGLRARHALVLPTNVFVGERVRGEERVTSLRTSAWEANRLVAVCSSAEFSRGHEARRFILGHPHIALDRARDD